MNEKITISSYCGRIRISFHVDGKADSHVEIKIKEIPTEPGHLLKYGIEILRSLHELAFPEPPADICPECNVKCCSNHNCHNVNCYLYLLPSMCSCKKERNKLYPTT